MNNRTSTSNVVDEYLATGDNYSCGQPCPPGFFIYTPPAKTLKAQMQAEGHGNEERKVVETTIQENKELTSFRDTVGVKEDDLGPPITKIHVLSDPYKEAAITQLKRQYIIDQTTWASTDVQGTRIALFDFPLLLLNVSKISEILNRFKYFRGEVVYECRLNSTTYHSGKLLICYSPHHNYQNLQGQATTDDMWHMSCFETITLSACANETVRVHIPYVAPSAYWDLQKDSSDSTNSGFFGTIQVYILAPLRLVGSAAASLTLTSYASFENPEVAGYIPKGSSEDSKQLHRTENDKFKVSSKK